MTSTHLYTHWLANNFHQSHTTNQFAPDYIDDIDIIINDYDDYIIIPDTPLYIPPDESCYTYDDLEDDDEFNIINPWLFD
jgi:hypothetical protein